MSGVFFSRQGYLQWIGVSEKVVSKRDLLASLLRILLVRVPHRPVRRWGTVRFAEGPDTGPVHRPNTSA